MLELCIINAMCLYFCKNPQLAKKRQAHKKFRLVLVHELVQPLLDVRDATLESRSTPNYKPNPRSRRSESAANRLVGKHYNESQAKRKKCTMCAYQKIPGRNKRKNKRTNDYYPKCKVHICEDCFKDFHSKSQI